MNKMKFSKAVVLKERDDVFPARRLIKYNGRFYTVFGRLFAVRGDHLYGEQPVSGMPFYGFSDWPELIGMYRDEK